MTHTLWSIGEDLDAIASLLDEQGGDVSDTTIDTIIDAWLDEARHDLRQKLDGYAALIQERRARATARQDEASRLSRLADMDAQAASRLKARVLLFLQVQQIQRIETARYRLSVSGNGGLLPLILAPEITGESLPESYVRTERRPDLERLRAALEKGYTIPGVTFGTRGMHLRIR